MLSSCCKKKCQDYELWTGLLLFVSGAVLILQRIDILPSETWSYLWPVLLLILGVKLMILGGSCTSCCDKNTMPTPAEKKKTTAKRRRVAKKK